MGSNLKKWLVSYKLKGYTMTYQKEYLAASNFSAVIKFYDEMVRGVFPGTKPNEVTEFSVKGV
ncbi:MAG: hypothetical protein IKC23_05125 [Fibrobacter sp.]|nr:hypothetical protein [Fibrobacter sp.]